MKFRLSKILRDGKDTGLRSTKKGGVKVKKTVFYDRESVKRNIEKILKDPHQRTPTASQG